MKRQRCLKLAAAAAEAKSGFPDALRGATLGKLEPIAAPVDDLFTPTDDCKPLIVECRLGAEGLIGELLGMSRFLTADPFLKLVAGGSGKGREVEGVCMVLNRLIGELLRVVA